jgi:hypothetical protein
LLIEETQEEILTEELLSFFFQLEIFADIPGVGTISGALLNLAFMRRVDLTAQRVFQERWLRHNGKVHAITPAAIHERHLAPGWAGALGRAAYSGTYGLAFGVTLPVWLVAALVAPMAGAVGRETTARILSVDPGHNGSQGGAHSPANA